MQISESSICLQESALLRRIEIHPLVIIELQFILISIKYSPITFSGFTAEFQQIHEWQLNLKKQ